VSYGYNGLGDRLSETVNGQTTHYTIDLNAGLTQVLQDGTNTYLYGADRIAQYNTNGPEYYLGDALGSVRQMVDANGDVTLGRMYKPYGGVLSSVGGGATNYGFTNEWTDTSTGDVYLRSRWYAPGQSRFLTKDTWEGDEYEPMSLNFWNYVQSNPINYQDPTGNDRYPPPGTRILCPSGWLSWDIKARVDEAEKYAPRIAGDEMSTYVAAGIAIQCAGTDFIRNASSSVGIAQISYPDAETELKEDEYGKALLHEFWKWAQCPFPIGNFQ
jgi:RHS repeat-associated protein